MDDLRPDPDSNGDTGASPGTPHWVYMFGFIALTGGGDHGLGRHQP